MSVFDFLNDIIAKKKGAMLDDPDNMLMFNHFLLQRWCSFYSESFTELLNTTSNRLYPVLENKETWYKFLLTIIPKSRIKKISYIKKEKKQPKPQAKQALEFIAKNCELSKREVREYVEFLDLSLEDFGKKL